MLHCAHLKGLPQPQTHLKSSADNGRLQKAELRAKRLGGERDVWNRLVSVTLQSPAFHARVVCFLSATQLYVVWSKGQSPLYPICEDQTDRVQSVFFSTQVQFYQSWRPETETWSRVWVNFDKFLWLSLSFVRGSTSKRVTSFHVGMGQWSHAVPWSCDRHYRCWTPDIHCWIHHYGFILQRLHKANLNKMLIFFHHIKKKMLFHWLTVESYTPRYLQCSRKRHPAPLSGSLNVTIDIYLIH